MLLFRFRPQHVTHPKTRLESSDCVWNFWINRPTDCFKEEYRPVFACVDFTHIYWFLASSEFIHTRHTRRDRLARRNLFFSIKSSVINDDDNNNNYHGARVAAWPGTWQWSRPPTGWEVQRNWLKSGKLLYIGLHVCTLDSIIKYWILPLRPIGLWDRGTNQRNRKDLSRRHRSKFRATQEKRVTRSTELIRRNCLIPQLFCSFRVIQTLTRTVSPVNSTTARTLTVPVPSLKEEGGNANGHCYHTVSLQCK